jgi:hypothetical protein
LPRLPSGRPKTESDPLAGARKRGIKWHQLADAVRRAMRQNKTGDPRGARGIIKLLAERSGYSPNRISRVLSAMAYVDLVAPVGTTDRDRLLALPLPKLELIRRMCARDPTLSPRALADDIQSQRLSVRELSERRRAQPMRESGVPMGSEFEFAVLETMRQHLELLTDLPGEARLVLSEPPSNLYSFDALIETYHDGSLELAAALDIRDLSRNTTRQRLMDFAARAAFGSSFVTRFFYVVRGPTPGIDALAKLLDELGLQNVGVIQVDSNGGNPVVVRRPSGLPVPDRRRLLLERLVARKM